MITKHYCLELTFAGPLLSQASGTLRMGMDTAMQRDSEGFPVLNGSLIRGNIRDVLQQFACTLYRSGHLDQGLSIAEKLEFWFGKAATDFESQRAKVQLDFFWRLQNTHVIEEAQRTRIQMDNNGRVKDGALQVLEDCFPLGTTPVFAGKLRGQFADEAEAQEFEKLIKMALQYIPAMGSLKGIGFGRLLDANLSVSKTESSSVSEQPEWVKDCFGLQFTFDRPFCIGKPRTPESNRIESEEVIPGQVLKAIIAQQYGDDRARLQAELCFDELIFSHFQPASSKTPVLRTPPIPLSLAFVDKVLHDFSVNTVNGERAPEFKPDWKSKQEQAANEKLNRKADSPKRLLLVRTGIDSTTQTASEGQLFSLECVDPAGFVWCGNISLANVPADKHATVLQHLHDCLMNGLHGIGKTKAAVSELVYTPPFAYVSDEAESRALSTTITLTLMTPARLFPLGWERQNPGQTARELYQDYWHGISGGSLELDKFFAQQERVGGAYHYHRFQRKQGNDYSPEWLTTAGSVFVLQVKDVDKARPQIEQWLRKGLPLPQQETDTWKPQERWQKSSYLSEHGYGEVVLNWYPDLQGDKA
ncbi:MAG: hypothetical protein BWK73_39775 [Thiothrix lacustris]|uniref:Uncharacterized protein n=1 Tax=Thiothrix lacustris TaxID=525917 RepID=A0A1Y1QE78_9GAMM|nr:MAG: hypothetical protein BWK73_39775 [Thiothrix lacustris]